MAYLVRQRAAAEFYRGGTSRGVVFNEHTLLRFAQQDRQRIICAAMGSPDPDGRQIDGLGGGTSSTSKVAIVGRSGSKAAAAARAVGEPLPGLAWIDDDLERARTISDVVYRAGQVPIREGSIDWGSTCGNMMAAVAQYSVNNTLKYNQPSDLPSSSLMSRDAKDKPHNEILDMLKDVSMTVRILAHDSGKVFRARVPLAPTLATKLAHSRHSHLGNSAIVWGARDSGLESIAGVPGTAPGIVIESPLEKSVLSTGSERDSIEVDGKKIEVTMIDAGLPVVVVAADAIAVPISELLEHPASIDTNVDLMQKLERIRVAASSLTPELSARLSLAAPKICVVAPSTPYTTTGGTFVGSKDADILARVVSSGQLHRSIPATTLSALAAARCFPKSIVSEVLAKSSQASTPSTTKGDHLESRPQHEVPMGCSAEDSASSHVGEQETRTITVGQPAGVSTASVQTRPASNEGGVEPAAIVMLRTARRIMQGYVTVPDNVERSNSLAHALKTVRSAEEGTKEFGQSPNAPRRSPRGNRNASKNKDGDSRQSSAKNKHDIDHTVAEGSLPTEQPEATSNHGRTVAEGPLPTERPEATFDK